MMHMLQHPDDTGSVLESLKDSHDKEQALRRALMGEDRNHYLAMLDRALENNLIDDSAAEPLRDLLFAEPAGRQAVVREPVAQGREVEDEPVSGPAEDASGAAPGAHKGWKPLKRRPGPPRYLKGQCPDLVRVGEPFSVLASIVRAAGDARGWAPLKSFPVGPDGEDILLVLHAPGLKVLSGQRQVVRVPVGGDSDPVMFEVEAAAPGPCRLSITAWHGGSYLGELIVETAVSPDPVTRSGDRDFVAGIETTAAEGAVSLVVRYDPVQKVYRFEFRDEDYPAEVTSHLAYEPGRRVEQLISGLDQLAKGRSGYSQEQVRDYLMNSGVGLWRELIPVRLREQFWERQQRIRQLTILADSDTVPWELLYPLDPGHDAGFLVRQFEVTRMVFGRKPSRSLSLSPARFVLPGNSPPQAHDEVRQLREMLGPDETAAGADPPVRHDAEHAPLMVLW